jgi:hypothetical protein
VDTFEPLKSTLTNRVERVIENLDKIRTVRKDEPGVGPFVPIAANDALQALPVEPKPARPS